MPFETRLADLEKRTSGRVIRADDAWVVQGAQSPCNEPAGSLEEVKPGGGLWVDLKIS